MRSPRIQSFLLVALLGSLVVTGSALAGTFGTQLAYQERDAIEVTATEYTLSADASELTVTFEINNPLARTVEITSGSLAAYEGDPPFVGQTPLSVPQSSAVEQTTVEAETSATITATLEIREEQRDAARRAAENDDIAVSGILFAHIRGGNFQIDVGGD